MIENLALYIALAFQGLITLGILIFAILSSRGFFQGGRFSGLKQKSKLEQRLILEALSSVAGERGVGGVSRLLCKLAEEKTGYEYTLLWVREGDLFKLSYAETGGEALGKQLTIEHPLVQWIIKNPNPVRLGRFILSFPADEQITRLLKPVTNGVMIPCLDGAHLQAFMFIGGRQKSRERRTDQFYSLFGAIAAISLRRARRDEEAEAMRHRQQQIENLARLGELAAGLAHEIRNPLTFVKSSTQHLVKQHGLGEKEPELIEGLVDEINRIDNTIRDLLDLGKVDTDEFAPVDMAEVLRRVVVLMEKEVVSQGVDIRLTAAGELQVSGDRNALHRLFMNLVINAMNAVEGGGTILLQGMSESGIVKVRVSDTGCGIDPGIVDRIFDPFFTTRDEGTGLGLAICHNAASVHGGELKILDPLPGFSTTMEVSLPGLKRA